MFPALNPIHQLFFGVSVVAIIMIATVIYMVNDSNYENTDRLETGIKAVDEILKGKE